MGGCCGWVGKRCFRVYSKQDGCCRRQVGIRSGLHGGYSDRYRDEFMWWRGFALVRHIGHCSWLVMYVAVLVTEERRSGLRTRWTWIAEPISWWRPLRQELIWLSRGLCDVWLDIIGRPGRRHRRRRSPIPAQIVGIGQRLKKMLTKQGVA